MCGISGIINLKSPQIDSKILKNMNDAIQSRGPDDEGFYLKDHAALGHRRLSIIDITGGHQPMTSADGRYTLVFNGEIYNFLELKAELEKDGLSFTTKSDSEVLLYYFIKHGIDGLKNLNGMFAFALWDSIDKKLFAARDRMGKKPFYYALVGDEFIFASELKALLKHPGLPKAIDETALKHYFTYEYVPAPYSIIKGVSKLKQAHYLLYDGNIKTESYWNQSFATANDDDEKTACKNLLGHLDQATTHRLISDVPLGVFLSGGVDSSAIVALMARQREGKDIKTFSINFKEASYDESLYSAAVAKHFGTDHHEQTLTASLMLDILPKVSAYMDEPFADGSILPTYLLSQFTRKHVTVALGGDGADELFAGYPTFFASRVAGVYQKFPSLFKKAAHGLTNMLPTSDKNMSLDFKARQFLMGADYKGVLKNQMWLAGVSQEEQKKFFTPEFLKNNPGSTLKLIEDEMQRCDSKRAGDQLLYFYQKFYMCDDILVKVDRASMANSLEVRAPFLDPNVVDYVCSLPYHYKLKGVTTKFILKRTFNKMLPAMVTQRSKKGFGIPIAGWLKNELKSLLLNTLNQKRIESEGIFHWPFINELMQQHITGKRNNRKQLFSLLMFHLWMDEYL
jgi:asparagine synthase (glutamine-hydrolysing)